MFVRHGFGSCIEAEMEETGMQEHQEEENRRKPA